MTGADMTGAGMTGAHDSEAAARQANGYLGQLCELTYRCLQAIDSDASEELAILLGQRQTVMSEIDRLHVHDLADSPNDLANSPETARIGHLENGSTERERRDLLHLLDSLDGEMIRLATLKRDAFLADFQKASSPFHGLPDHAAGRLFNRIG